MLTCNLSIGGAMQNNVYLFKLLGLGKEPTSVEEKLPIVNACQNYE